MEGVKEENNSFTDIADITDITDITDIMDITDMNYEIVSSACNVIALLVQSIFKSVRWDSAVSQISK